MKLILKVMLLGMLLPMGCTKPEDRAARDFRDKLGEEIRKAAFVEVVEHSDMGDFPDEAFPNYPLQSSDDVPKIEYARIRLSAEQKQSLEKRVRSMDESDSPAISFCSFVPHHAIELHSTTGLTSSIEICFTCQSFSWDGGELQGSPESWVTALEEFISGVGMRPKANWRDLVLESGRAPAKH